MQMHVDKSLETPRLTPYQLDIVIYLFIFFSIVILSHISFRQKMSLIKSFFIHSYIHTRMVSDQQRPEQLKIAQYIFMVLIITLNLSVFTICKPSAYRLYSFKKSTFEVKLNKAKYHHLNIQFHEFWQLYNIPESRYGIFPSPQNFPFPFMQQISLLLSLWLQVATYPCSITMYLSLLEFSIHRITQQIFFMPRFFCSALVKKNRSMLLYRSVVCSFLQLCTLFKYTNIRFTIPCFGTLGQFSV